MEFVDTPLSSLLLARFVSVALFLCRLTLCSKMVRHATFEACSRLSSMAFSASFGLSFASAFRLASTFSCSFRRLKIQRMQRLASLPYLSLTRTKERAFSGSYWRWSCGKNYSTPRVWPCGARYSSVWTLKFTGSCSSFISLL